MADIAKIEWSRDEYTIEKFVKLFPLPQAVLSKANPKGNKEPRTRPQSCPPFNDVFVLHSVRKKEVVRATDSLKNEFYLPLDSTTKVEVLWKDYKKFYDNVEELCSDFPAHVLVVEEDECLGIKNGDVLKLKGKITNRETKCLKCSFLRQNRTDVSIPFSYKGLFKTLGDLEAENVYLFTAVQFCKLPRIVKFIDNKLKIKRIEGTSRHPTSLSSLENVTLHEVIEHIDVIASQTTSDGQVIIGSIPLTGAINVIAPTAGSRGDPSYTLLCQTIGKQTTAEMVKNVGILHQRWFVFQEDDTQRFLSWNQQLLSLASLNLEDEPGRDRRISVDEQAPCLPPKKQPYKGQVMSKAPPPPPPVRRHVASEVQGLLTVPISNKNKSKSLPRLLDPSQSGLHDDSELGAQQNNKQQFHSNGGGGEGGIRRDVGNFIELRFGGRDNLDGEGGYVPMAGNVQHLQTKPESPQRRVHSDDLTLLMKVLPNPLTSAVPGIQGKQLSQGDSKLRETDRTRCEINSEGMTSPELPKPQSCDPRNSQTREANFIKLRFGGRDNLDGEGGYVPMAGNVQHLQTKSTKRQVHSEDEVSSEGITSPELPKRRSCDDRGATFPPRSSECANSLAIGMISPSPFESLQYRLNNSQEEAHLKMRFLGESSTKCEAYPHVPPLMVSADRRNDLVLLKSPKNPPPKVPVGLEFMNSKDLRSWSSREVLKFLKFINLDKYKKKFKEKKIDGEMLANLDQKGLRELNVTNSSHAAMILKLVHECIKHESPN